MIATRILVCGLEQRHQKELEGDLRNEKQFGKKAKVEFSFSPPFNPIVVQRSFDLLICYINPEDNTSLNDAYFQSLKDLIFHCGAWACLPILIVGEPPELQVQSDTKDSVEAYQTYRRWVRFYKLQASWYLSAGTRSGTVARFAKKTLDATWWGGQLKLDLPVLVIDEKGIIIRANDASIRKFGADLVTYSYTQAVEKGDTPDLPPKHQIAQAIEKRRHISYDLESINPAGKREWDYLLCTPIMPTDGARLAAVTFLEMPPWTQLRKVAAQFANVREPQELYDAITATAKEFGFERVRLYQSDRDNRVIHGRSASDGHDDKFQEEWEPITVADDKPSKITFSRNFPCLFICPKDGTDTKPLKHEDGEDTELVKYIDKRPEHCRGYKAGVNRWIEAPLVLSELGPDNKPNCRYWGKLSLDRGQSSDALDPRDLAGVALFARDAAVALANMDRLEAERRNLKMFRECSEHFANAIKSQKRDEPPAPTVETNDEHSVGTTKNRDSIRESVINQVNRLYLRLTGADCVLYRRFHESTKTLRLFGDVQWRDPTQGERLKAPPVVTHRPRPVGPDAKDTHHDPFAILDVEQPKPQIDNAMQKKCLKYLEEHHLEGAESEYLKRIRAEIQIPVFLGGKACGLVMAVKTSEDGFSSDLIPVLERLMHLVSVWIELAELYDGRLWLDQLLHIATLILPRLSLEENDDAFFAALATILTAHNGIGWNRVYIWSCRAGPPQTAELVYALGGLANDPAHTQLQQRLEDDPKLENLNDVVIQRLECPRPVNERGEIEDRLYDLCVDKPRNNKEPIQFTYGLDLTGERPRNEFVKEEDNRSVSTGEPEPSYHPLRWMLDRDYANLPDPSLPRTIPLLLPIEHPGEVPWFREMNAKYHDLDNPKLCMFGPELKYAFPMWYSEGSKLKPLGVIVVDMRLMSRNQDVDMISATEVLLGVFSVIFAARYELAPPFLEGYRDQRLRNISRVLQQLVHGRDLGIVWGELEKTLGDFLKQFSATGAEKDVTKIRELVSELNGRIKGVAAAQKSEPAALARIDDLGLRLKDIARKYEDRYNPTGARASDLPEVEVVCDVDAVLGVPLQCPPLALSEALYILLTNGVQATISAQKNAPIGTERAKVKLKITAERDQSPGTANLEEVITLFVRDYGCGVKDDVQKYLFLPGFSTAKSPKDRGRGLSILQEILQPNRGHISLEEPVDGVGGAQFVIRFAVPKTLVGYSS
jgi:signal transduction histidine kinase